MQSSGEAAEPRPAPHPDEIFIPTIIGALRCDAVLRRGCDPAGSYCRGCCSLDRISRDHVPFVSKIEGTHIHKVILVAEDRRNSLADRRFPRFGPARMPRDQHE